MCCVFWYLPSQTLAIPPTCCRWKDKIENMNPRTLRHHLRRATSPSLWLVGSVERESVLTCSLPPLLSRKRQVHSRYRLIVLRTDILQIAGKPLTCKRCGFDLLCSSGDPTLTRSSPSSEYCFSLFIQPSIEVHLGCFQLCPCE